MTRAEWLLARRKGIGASEAAAVFGLHPYISPLSLFYEKTSDTAPVEDSTDYQEWGHLLEPAIAAKYEKETGREVRTPGHLLYSDSERPFIIASPDRVTRPDLLAEDAWPLELKASDIYRADEDIPVHWQIQIQQQMLVLGETHGSFAILAAYRKFHVVDVERNDAFISLLIEKLEEFWDRVKTDRPPGVDGSKATTEALRRMYPRDRGTIVELPEEAARWAESLTEVQERIKLDEKREALLKNQLMASIADNTFGRMPDGSGFSLKTTKRAGYSVEPTEYRALRRVKQIKGELVA